MTFILTSLSLYIFTIWSLWPNIRSLPLIAAEKNVTKNVHICSMCIKINKVGKQEVGIWRVQKRYPQYGIPIWRLWPNITFLPSTVTEKNATKNILDGWKDGRTDGQTDRGKTVYPSSPSGSGGIIKRTIILKKYIDNDIWHQTHKCGGVKQDNGIQNKSTSTIQYKITIKLFFLSGLQIYPKPDIEHNTFIFKIYN